MIPLISIIVASFNKAPFISETIESVLNQRAYSDFELIIVDDKSNDGTDSLLESYSKKDQRINVVINPTNMGANYCRNQGIKLASGRYLIFLDADDLLGINCISNRVAFMEANPDLDFAVSTLQVFKNKTGDSAHKWVPDSRKPLIDFLSHQLPWQTMQPTWKKEVVVNTGGFDETFQRLQDVEFHTRVLLNENLKFKIISTEPDCYFRIDESRKNFNEFDFLSRWVNSTVMYHHKFYDIAKTRKLNKYLNGTIYKIYVQVVNYYKTKKITKAQLSVLQKKLLLDGNIEGLSGFNFFLLRVSGTINSLPLRVPGINWLINKLIIHF